MNNSPRIFVAGHLGMVGSAIVRALKKRDSECDIIVRKRSDLNLLCQAEVKNFFNEEKPDQVYLAAAKVGGIHANDKYPAEFIYENMMIEANVIHEAWASGVKKLLFLGSSCIYPKLSEQPILEDALLTGPLEKTNEPYAIAKIAGIKLCESYNRQFGHLSGVDFRSIMPTNLYGPGDDYHPLNSHVIPALIRRFHEAKLRKHDSVIVWGTGKPKREFLFVNDMAEACLQLMGVDIEIYKEQTDEMLSHINVGSGADISINELAMEIADCINYKGKIIFDNSKPDGTQRKLMNSEKMRSLGWKPRVNLEKGLALAYADFCENY
jgi:GDP-L-fucose synthase